MEAIVLVLHLCTLSDSLLGFENCKPMVVPEPTTKACLESARAFNGPKRAKLPRHWKREETRIGQTVLVAPAHCEKPWHPTRNPRGQTIYTSPVSADRSNPAPQPCDNQGPYCERDAQIDAHLDKTEI
jgi:hypothetical protein